VKIDKGDPLQETFRIWREGGVEPSGAKAEDRQAGLEAFAPALDAAGFVDYVEPLLSELETMAKRLDLEELRLSLSLCRNVARLSGGGGSAGLTD